jgi:hypothetical protein
MTRGLSPIPTSATDAGLQAAFPIGGKIVGKAASRLGTLVKAADNVWDSASGLRYPGKDSTGLNRVEHVLRHAAPDPTRANHSVFSVSRNKVLALVDEAWGSVGSH